MTHRITSKRITFPDTPIDGRVKHRHMFDAELGHGCVDHFSIEDHSAECRHAHDGVGHLISLDAECGFVRDPSGRISSIRFGKIEVGIG